MYISFRKKIKHEDSSENRFYRDSEYMFRLPVYDKQNYIMVH